MTGGQMLIEKGRAEGRAEGRTELLLKLLEVKFGTPPEETAKRARSASIEEIDRWAERVLTAKTLAEVFG